MNTKNTKKKKKQTLEDEEKVCKKYFWSIIYAEATKKIKKEPTVKQQCKP